jgi:hypothetical protein
MVRDTNRLKQMQSWITPSFAWMIEPDIFLVEASVSDPDIVEFISTGVLDVTPTHAQMRLALATVRLCNVEGSLRRHLGTAVWKPAKLRPPTVSLGTRVHAHCHGVFVLPGGTKLCVAVCWNRALSPAAWIAPALKDEADKLFLAYQAEVTQFEESEDFADQNHKYFLDRLRENENYRDVPDWSFRAPRHWSRPILTVERLLHLLPCAAKFRLPANADTDRTARAAIAAITESGWPTSRDGFYAGLIPKAAGAKSEGLVSWSPHTGLPSYPEVRWAVQKGLPGSLRKPRGTLIAPPRPVEGTLSPMDATEVDGSGLNPIDLKDALDELHLDDKDYLKRLNDVRADTKAEGFEAIAWFQAFHAWTEEAWGIYFDSRKLDDLALSYLDDFKSLRVQGSSNLAGFLAFGLTYAHEMFHAHVEAALSMQELTAKSPRYLRYNETVYQALRETPGWLEEALANWSAWNWFKALDTQAVIADMSSNIEGVARVVEASLDLSPPGYQDWRLGHELGTWRTFANQLATGKTTIGRSGISLPLEGWLNGDPLYEFLPSDIPLRFVGPGAIADRLQSQPGTFGVPARRELERALKHFQHRLDASGGKGGHQKWTGPDQRAFILPTCDPVSRGVFNSFLHHVGINKHTYVREVRPNL